MARTKTEAAVRYAPAWITSKWSRFCAPAGVDARRPLRARARVEEERRVGGSVGGSARQSEPPSRGARGRARADTHTRTHTGLTDEDHRRNGASCASDGAGRALAIQQPAEGYCKTARRLL